MNGKPNERPIHRGRVNTSGRHTPKMIVRIFFPVQKGLTDCCGKDAECFHDGADKIQL